MAESVNITYDTSFWGNSSSVYTGWPSFQWPGLKTQIEAFQDIPGVEFPTDSGAGKAGVYVSNIWNYFLLFQLVSPRI